MPATIEPDWERRAARNYRAIKAYYEKRGGKDWTAITANPVLFNRVWRSMLRLPRADIPPAIEYRI